MFDEEIANLIDLNEVILIGCEDNTLNKKQMHFMRCVQFTDGQLLNTWFVIRLVYIAIYCRRCPFVVYYHHTNIENQFILRPNIKCVFATYDERWRSIPTQQLSHPQIGLHRFVMVFRSILHSTVHTLPPPESYGRLWVPTHGCFENVYL